MKIAIIQFPGSNCETESLYAVQQAGMEAEEFLWNQDRSRLEAYDGYVIVGGFSYEDRSRSGVIASLDPVMKVLAAKSEKGKPILGICNGAQILVETGLVPGLKNLPAGQAGNALGMALAINSRVKDGHVLGTGYYNAWVNVVLAIPPELSAFTNDFDQGEKLTLAVAHGEGRFVMEPELLKEMIEKNLTVLRYSDEHGIISTEFPVNPNGAMYNLAAVGNASGNILAIMPHPERGDGGKKIFSSMRNFIAEEQRVIIKDNTTEKTSFSYVPPSYTPQTYTKDPNSVQLTIDLLITDNEAGTVRNALSGSDIHANIRRQTTWEICFEEGVNKEELLKKIIATGELFNSNKERIANNYPPRQAEQQKTILVRYREDVLGQSKMEALTDRFGIQGIKSIKKGIMWHIGIENGNIDLVVDNTLKTHILFNQFSQEAFFV